jgi:rubredoxin
MSQYQCPNCNSVYDERLGCPHEGYPAGSLWKDLPAEFTCPVCFLIDKDDFQ